MNENNQTTIKLIFFFSNQKENKKSKYLIRIHGKKNVYCLNIFLRKNIKRFENDFLFKCNYSICKNAIIILVTFYFFLFQ